jgi:hypothetical protein
MPAEIAKYIGASALATIVLLGVGSSLIYGRVPNTAGSLKGFELGPKWQYADYLSQHPHASRVHQITRRLKIAAFGVLLGVLATFCCGGLTIFSGNFVPLLAIALWYPFVLVPYLLTGIDAVLTRAAILPRGLWLGKRQFATGAKAAFGGYCIATLSFAGIIVLALYSFAMALLWVRMLGQFP